MLLEEEEEEEEKEEAEQWGKIINPHSGTHPDADELCRCGEIRVEAPVFVILYHTRMIISFFPPTTTARHKK